jgi:hypothetical protein
LLLQKNGRAVGRGIVIASVALVVPLLFRWSCRCCSVVSALLFRGCDVVDVSFASGILAVSFIECFEGLDHDWIMIETRTMATEGFRKNFG